MHTESSFISPFRSYIRMTSKEIEDVLKNSMIVLDTNVLLGLYRVTPAARGEMLQSIDAAGDRLWIPHQVALEFHKNRINVAHDQINFYEQMINSIESLKRQTLQKIGEFGNRCILDEESKKKMKEVAIEAFGSTVDEIKKHRDRFDLGIPTILNQDPVLDELSVILDGRIGVPFETERLAKVLAEGKRRASEKIPPGYKDEAKSSNGFGDYLMWEQTLDEAKSRRVNVLIVSNDMKEDWVEKRLGLVIGPRTELVEELRSQAGVDLNIMTFPLFLEAAKRHLQANVSVQTLAQALKDLPQGVIESRLSVQISIPEDSIKLVREGLKMLLRSAERAATDRSQELADLNAREITNTAGIEAIENLLGESRMEIATIRGSLNHFEEAIRRSFKKGGMIYLEMPESSASIVQRILKPTSQSDTKSS